MTLFLSQTLGLALTLTLALTLIGSCLNRLSDPRHTPGNYSTDLSGFQAVLAHKATKSNYLQLVSEAYGNVSAPYREGFYDNPNVTTHILHGTRQPTCTFIDSDETKDDYDTYCEAP